MWICGHIFWEGKARRGLGRKGQERDGAMKLQDGGKAKKDVGTHWGQERERGGEQGCWNTKGVNDGER